MGTCCSKNQVIEYSSTKIFIPPITKAQVIKVYDGDTFTIAVKFPWDNKQYYRFSVRIKGIDCPEIRTKNANERYVAKRAQEFVSKLILYKTVLLKDVKYEKYGRLCADVFVGKLNLGQSLIAHRLAVEYHGGQRQQPSDWKRYYNTRSRTTS